MVTMRGATAPRAFYGWWVARALSIIVFLSAGTRFTIGPFLNGGCGTAFGVAGALRLLGAILSLASDEAARPACHAVAMPPRPHPVAGGR